MQLFLRQRDLDLFNTMTQDLIEDIIQTPILLYKLVVSSMPEDDLYGDSLEKVYYQPIEVMGLIEHDAETVEHTDIGIDTGQGIVANFQREILRGKDVYPEIGDVIRWNNNYYEIHNVNENRLAAGQQDQNFNYEIRCFAHLARQSKVLLEEYRAGKS